MTSCYFYTPYSVYSRADWILATTEVQVRDLSSSLSRFCSHLKTELFSRAYGINSP